MTQSFMIFLIILFIITLARVWIDRLPLLKPYIVVAIAAFTVVNYISVDTMIVKGNIERYHNTKAIDVSYFRTLSNDAAGEIIKLADDGDPAVAAEVRALLKERGKRLVEVKDWESFNLADYRTKKLLEEWEKQAGAN
jgi:hypothetical protein